MSKTTFDRPIYLKEGKHLVREIESIDDAIEFLYEWPEDRRDAIYETTLCTCLMAYDGLKPIKVARDAMRAFGVKKDILEKAPAVQPWMIKQGSGGLVSA